MVSFAARAALTVSRRMPLDLPGLIPNEVPCHGVYAALISNNSEVCATGAKRARNTMKV